MYVSWTLVSSLTWCVQLTDSSLRHIGARLTYLEWLSLFGLRTLTSDGLAGLAACQHLMVLNINGCAGITLSKHQVHALLPSLRTLVPL